MTNTTSQKNKSPRPARSKARAAEVFEKQNSSPIVPKEVDASQYITVRNGFQSESVYEGV